MTHELGIIFEGSGETKGFVFTQKNKSQEGYIYQVDSEGSLHYEVFTRKETPVCIDFENRIYSDTETKIKYPKSNDFGVWAWTFNSYKNALMKYSELEFNNY